MKTVSTPFATSAHKATHHMVYYTTPARAAIHATPTTQAHLQAWQAPSTPQQYQLIL